MNQPSTNQGPRGVNIQIQRAYDCFNVVSLQIESAPFEAPPYIPGVRRPLDQVTCFKVSQLSSTFCLLAIHIACCVVWRERPLCEPGEDHCPMGSFSD